jgi:tRNA nucleotidyltransferase (CCA-adding enzyme)
MQLGELEKREFITQSLDANAALDRLFRFRGDDNYELYTLLFQYDTETLLYMMAKANSEKIRRLISNYLTRLKRTEIALRGRDLKVMGFPPGPLYKEIFESILKARLNNLVGTRDDEVRFAKKTFRKHLKMR